MRFLMLLLPILALAGEPDLPRELEAVKTSYDRDLEKLKAEHDAAVLKRTDAYRVKLLDVQTALTKGGDLDGALAAKRFREALPLFAVPEKAKDPPPGNMLSSAQASDLASRMDAMSAEEWDGLRGSVFRVDGGAFTATPVLVKDGESYLLIPCPYEKWGSFSYKGNPAQQNWIGTRYQGGALLWTLSNERAGGSADLFIRGQGKLGFYSNYGVPNPRLGVIRIKLFKVQP